MTFYRRNLPHWHPEGKCIFITWRLHDSLPASFLRKNRTAKNGGATNAHAAESPGKQFRKLDSALDSAKSGPLWLADPEIAAYAEYPIVRGAQLGR
jgi:putative transposase